MAKLPGLFHRSGTYYLRVVVPKDIQDALGGRTKTIKSLGTSNFQEAKMTGARHRAEALAEFGRRRGQLFPQASFNQPATASLQPIEALPSPPPKNPSQGERIYFKEVFDRWTVSQPRSADSINACRRAVWLFKEFAGELPLQQVTRSLGDGFRAWLQDPKRRTTSKTARDRLTWVKSILKYAARDLGVIPQNPWEGLDITYSTTKKRRPWTDPELHRLFSQPLFLRYELPKIKKAGSDAAYWLPLLGLFTGARVGELAQLRVSDVLAEGGRAILSITDDGEGQSIKSNAGIRRVPIHSELVRLGFMAYVSAMKENGEDALWPKLPKRLNKPGGYFSQWFGDMKAKLGFGECPDFHCFRHTVRTQLAESDTPEPAIDALLGHEVTGSTGAKVYTHRSLRSLQQVVEQLHYPCLSLPRVFTASA